MLHKEIPFIRLVIPLCLGIISGLLVRPGLCLLAAALFLIITGFSVSLFFNRYPSNIIYGISCNLFLFTSGMFLYHKEKDDITMLERERTVFCCTLSDFPEEKANTWMLRLKLLSQIPGEEKDQEEYLSGSIVAYHEKDTLVTSWLPGDVLLLSCTPLEITNRGNPGEFDYMFYMENHGIRYYTFTRNSDIILHTTPLHRNIKHKALIIRNKIIDRYRAGGITGKELALVAAITLGQKNMLDPEQEMSFIEAGAVHIMAVSGLHAMILSIFIYYLLFFLGKRYSWLRAILTVVLLWSFAFVTGLSTSVVRASFMFTFLQAGRIMRRPVNTTNSLLASAFILIMIRPSMIFDAGFLLSYSAVLYIITFHNDLYHLLSFRNRIADRIWQAVAVTLVAQAGTLPLSIMLFNRFPVYFILSGIIVIPLASLLIITAFLVPLSYPAALLSLFFGRITNGLATVTGSVTSFISSLPHSTLTDIGITVAECLLLTMTIFIFCYYILRKRPFPVLYPVVMLLLLVTAGTIKDISTRRSNELIVYNTNGYTAIGIRRGKVLDIYSDTTQFGQEVTKGCATLGIKIIPNKITRDTTCCIMAGRKKILISGAPDEHLLRTLRPDIVVVTLPGHLKDMILPDGKPPEALVITAESDRSDNSVPEDFFMNIDTIHEVSKCGAYIKEL